MSARLFALVACLAGALPAFAGPGTGSPGAAPTGDSGSSLDLPVTPNQPSEPGAPRPTPTPPDTGEPRPIVIFGHAIPVKEEIVYVIDTSCSMRGDPQAYVDPVSGMREVGTRLERAQAEVIQSIRSLPERVKFNVVRFDSRIESCWITVLGDSTPLHPADGGMKQVAITWVESFTARGATATGPAVVVGLDLLSPTEDDAVVVLITDGAPTAWSPDPDEHRALIRRSNRAPHRVDVIGIAATGTYRAFCLGVAHDNGGGLVDVP